jgi:thioesterase domain-containing protein
MPSLPLTPNGKLDLRALPLPGLRPEAEIRVAPSTPEQCRLHRLWGEVLGHADFGITDNFFLAGGDSLAAARLATSLQGALNQEVSVKWIFRWPTIEEQAARMLTLRHLGPAPNLVFLQPLGSRPPLFLVHGLGGSVGGFIELARALAPERPAIGLQATERERMDPSSASVEQMAEGYAEQILAMHQGAPIHLLGYSVGGWYAHAVAAALLKRGAPVGLFAVLDTHPTARIHRRIGLVLLLQRLQVRLLPHLRGLLQPPAGQRRRRYLRGRLQAVNQHLHDHLRVRFPVPGRVSADGEGASTPPSVGDAYAQLPWDGYRPPRLPLVVDLFAPEDHLPFLQRLWSFYARSGVRCHSLFREHHEFGEAERIPELAAALESALQRAER